jgi:hypothetical protein
MQEEFEEWRPVVGWEGVYDVSSLGRIRRVKTSGNSKAGHILKPQLNRDGYPLIRFRKPGVAKMKAIHKAVAEAFLGPCPDGLEVNHIDFDKQNCRANNLEYTTRRNNMLHAYASGRMAARGEKHGHSHLQDDQVHQICRMFESGHDVTFIAEFFGTKKRYVSGVVYGKTYKHISCSYKTGDRPRKRKIFAEQESEMRRLCAAGWSQLRVARKLGISQASVSITLNRPKGREGVPSPI